MVVVVDCRESAGLVVVGLLLLVWVELCFVMKSCLFC